MADEGLVRGLSLGYCLLQTTFQKPFFDLSNGQLCEPRFSVRLKRGSETKRSELVNDLLLTLSKLQPNHNLTLTWLGLTRLSLYTPPPPPPLHHRNSNSTRKNGPRGLKFVMEHPYAILMVRRHKLGILWPGTELPGHFCPGGHMSG